MDPSPKLAHLPLNISSELGKVPHTSHLHEADS